MSRHVFLQRAGATGLVTHDHRADHGSPDHGLVEEARYLRWEERGLWARLFGSSRPRRAEELRFVLPFGADGSDVLDLCEAHPLFEGGDDVGVMRRARGRIVCLEPRTPGDDVVLRDLWLEDPPVVRLVESIDFGVVAPSGPPVAVCCAMAPLVVATPAAVELDTFVAALGERASGLLLRHAGARTAIGACVQLREGEDVEVIGLVCDPETSVQRFDATGRSAPYRGGPRRIDRILGDEPGTRLVIRRLYTAPEARK
jgi:hypothetical protein